MHGLHCTVMTSEDDDNELLLTSTTVNKAVCNLTCNMPL